MPTDNTHADELLTRTIAVRVTDALYDRMENIRKRRGKNIKMTDLGHEAIRDFVTQQEDTIGSRAHFTKSLRERFDELQNALLQQLTQLQSAVLQQDNAHFLEFTKLALHITPPSSPQGHSPPDDDTVPLNSELVMLELHTLLRLQLAFFSFFNAQLHATDPRQINPAAMLNEALTTARDDTILYEQKMAFLIRTTLPRDVTDEAIETGLPPSPPHRS